MAKTVDEAFNNLASWVAPTATETASAASHRSSIEACLKTNFGMTAFLKTGSFGHNTSVRSCSDIDYFAVIPTANLKENSSSTLHAIRSVLAARFPRTLVTVRSPAVVIPFGTSTGERHEITPADFIRRTGDGHNIYDIPDRYQGWMKSSPSVHNSWVNGINGRLNYKVKPLIRMLKAWNYYRDVGIRSFYLELRVAEYAATQSSIIYKHDVSLALHALRGKGLASMQDPAAISGLIAPCTTVVKPTALSKIDTALSRTSKALEAEKKGDIAGAFYWWGLVFNGFFPSYY